MFRKRALLLAALTKPWKNWTAHIRWKDPEIWKQLPEITIDISDASVCFPVGDMIPGPRPLLLVEKCSFPWKGTVDAVEIVESADAYNSTDYQCHSRVKV